LAGISGRRRDPSATEPARVIFSNWQSFYELTGEAAATLTGLLFVVATLTSSGEEGESARGVKYFLTPTVFQLASVLVISALALAPAEPDISPTLIMAGWSVAGAAYAAWLAVSIGRMQSLSHWSDLWWYGIWPAVIFLTLAGATVLVCIGFAHAAYFAALCLLALLGIAIRNAWDLVTWLAPRRDGK
jgi:hypothetical protein